MRNSDGSSANLHLVVAPVTAPLNFTLGDPAAIDLAESLLAKKRKKEAEQVIDYIGSEG